MKRSFVLLMASFMALSALAIDFLLPAFPDIRQEYGFDADSSAPSQLITVFFVGLAVGQMVHGPLSDRFGRKRMIYFGLGLYVLGAVAAALAPTFGVLLLCRFVWGFGAAAPRSMTLAMVRDTMHGDVMARVMSQIMSVFLFIPVIAPAVGAGLIQIAAWQIVIWIPALAAVLLGLWLTRVPETLPVEHRRSVAPRALLDAFRAVVTTRVTLAMLITVTLVYGMLTAFIGGIELIVDDVYDRKALLPLTFGIIGCCLGGANMLSARIVGRVGLRRLIRAGAIYVLATSTALAVLVLATDGKPPLWALTVALAFVLGGAGALIPNSNTAAIAPLPHVAGMAAAVLGAISTGVGALLGALVDSAFDGTVTPYAVATLACAGGAAVAVFAAGPSTERVPADLEWVSEEPPVAP